ncbi:MAG: symmetrical bis(5'-nucleosyl)-tetraphosphatase [Lysobacterales bacterium]|jgi:bis(5'-nucleosyl)-tetraphosphatase (symmetrical)
MATYIVGDIQGCYDALQRLLEKIRFDPAVDELWSPGDLVNRGKQSLETLRLLEGLGDRFRMTLGNHDLYLLREHWRFPGGGSANHEIDAILHAPDCERLIGWLRGQPLACWSAEHQLLMVHAGVIPQWSVEKTLACAAEVEGVMRSPRIDKFFAKSTKPSARRWDDDLKGWRRRSLITTILTRIRFCDANGKILTSASGPPGSQPAPYKPWFKHKHRLTGGVTVAFGHWAALGLYRKKNLMGLDSGCVWGGRLSAVRLEDQQLFQVPGKFHAGRVSWSADSGQ